jgi:hypothetical protein
MAGIETKRPLSFDEHLEVLKKAPEPFYSSYRAIIEMLTKNKATWETQIKTLKETNQKLQVSLDNANAKVKGQFKSCFEIRKPKTEDLTWKPS